MGAGIVECDVTFTKDLELICRHAQCDLHTTTDVVMRPEMNAKCKQPWSTGVTPTCCASDFTLAEIKTLCAKMDSSGDVNATSAEGYVFGGTPNFRTDLYQYGCQEVPTHKESIEIIRGNNGKFTPELKSPDVKMPFNGFSQEDYARKMIQEYIDAGVPPENVWPQSFNIDDILFWIGNTEFGDQAVALDGDYEKSDADLATYLTMLDDSGVKYVAPPMWRLVEPNPDAGKYGEYDMQPSIYANLVKTTTNLKIITWTLNRAAPPLGESDDWYWQTLENQGLNLTEGSNFDLVHVLHSEVGVEGIFDDWPAVTAFYGNCFDIKTRLYR
jgi:glycerophosphoryl diester phosphodiesterase